MKGSLKLIALFLGITLLFSCKKESTITDPVVVQASTMLNVNYGAVANQNMDLYLPAGRTAAATKVIIMVHGGAWFAGDKSDLSAFVDTLKRRLPDYAIFNINYRLSAFPNNIFPSQELDVKAAVEYIYNKRSDYLISDKFVFVGVSAGAHLSLLHAYKYNSPVKIKTVIDFFGPTDMTDLYNNPGAVPQASITTIVGATPTSNPLLYQQSSPVNFVSATSCPTLILQGGADPLVNPVSQSGVLNNKLVTAAVASQFVLYPGKGHGDDWGPDIFFDAFNKVQAFLALHNP